MFLRTFKCYKTKLGRCFFIQDWHRFRLSLLHAIWSGQSFQTMTRSTIEKVKIRTLSQNWIVLRCYLFNQLARRRFANVPWEKRVTFKCSISPKTKKYSLGLWPHLVSITEISRSTNNCIFPDHSPSPLYSKCKMSITREIHKSKLQ